MNRRVIVAGSRSFTNYELAKAKIYGLIGGSKIPIEIVSGHAEGADVLGERYARDFGHDKEIMPAEWGKYGKSAGMIRNKAMAEYASDAVFGGALIAFWDGVSDGTRNMISTARRHGLKVDVIYV